MKKLEAIKTMLDIVLRLVILVCVVITLRSSLKANKDIESIVSDVSVYKTFISQSKEEELKEEFSNEF